MMTFKPPAVTLAGQYGTNEAAEALGVSRKTLKRWRDGGLIKFHRHKTGRAYFLGRDIIRFWQSKM